MKKVILGFFLFLLIVLLIAGVSAVLAKDLILKAVLEYSVTRLTGFHTTVESLHFEFPLNVEVKNLEMKNPPGFREPVFARAPELYLSLDHQELFRKERVHFYELRLNIQEIFIERDEQGITNVSKLKPEKKNLPEESVPKKKGMPFYIDRLELTIRQLHYEDRSPIKVVPRPLAPAANILGKGVKEVGKGVGEVVPLKAPERKISVDLNMRKQVFTEVEKLDMIIDVILHKVLYGKTLGNFKSLGIDPAGFREALDVQQALGSVKADVTGVAASAKNQIEGLLGLKKPEESKTNERPKRGQ